MKRVNKISNSVVAAVVTNQVMLMERFFAINRKLNAKLPNNRSQSEGMFTSVFFRLARFESLYLKRSQGDTPLLRQIKLLKPNVLQYPTPPPPDGLTTSLTVTHPLSSKGEGFEL